MSDMNGAIVLIYCPCPTLGEAKRIGGSLLDARLAGSINILPGMVSLYDWKGARVEANEALLIAKTSSEAAPRLRTFLEEHHPYDVPAILTLPVADMNAAYADWLTQGITLTDNWAGSVEIS
jgi:periplasmic divalent cation tolerance protein